MPSMVDKDMTKLQPRGNGASLTPDPDACSRTGAHDPDGSATGSKRQKPMSKEGKGFREGRG